MRFTNTAITTITTIVMLNCGSVWGQVVSDGTTDTRVTVDQQSSSITGGIQSGQNLFHSFEQFSLTTNTIADFNHALDIKNIFSRVTGGISEIDGLIQTHGNANLFLLNPAGIVFGANAQLNVGGSFIASTGDRVIFEDGVEFSAVDPETEPLLTINSPVGLQYGNGEKITVLPNADRVFGNSGLNVRPGNTLALLGGDVSLERNSLNAIGSNVEIGSVNSGRIELQPHDNGWQFSYANAEDLGRIDLINRALMNSSGIVNFTGKTINILAESAIRNFTDFTGTAGTITLEATESLNINNSVLLTQVGQQLNPDLAIAGVGGDILLKAPQIFVSNGSLISAGTLSNGTGGNITIDASETIKLVSEAGNPSIISTSTQGIGDGGQIAINTGSLIIKDGSQVQALAGQGRGGTIEVNANKAVNISGTGILRSPIDEQGNLSETRLTSGFSASSGIVGLPLEQQPQGESGNLIINTPNLTIEDEAQISVSNYGLTNAGDIRINTSTLNLDTAGEIMANTASGEGGSINIVASESVILDKNSAISTTADREGNGGNISLETDNLVLIESNKISADASQGNGGKITIDAQGLFTAPGNSITANSEDERKIGSVKIFSLDLDSRLETDYRVQSSFVAENVIETGCGARDNLTKNQFRNIGRGGIPNNPLQEVAIQETIADLETDRHETSKSVKQQRSFKPNTYDDRSITEANTWMINSQGAIELIATANTTWRSPSCQGVN